jgi:hypothetical protein
MAVGSPTDIYVAGSGGNVAHWDGTSWTMMQTGTTENITKIAVVPGVGGVAVGSNGVYLVGTP